jgi:transposase
LSAVVKKTGLSYQKPRRSVAEADETEQKEFYDELKKAAEDGRHRNPY